MKDFQDDPRVKNLQPKQRKVMIEKLADLEAATAWDALSAEIEEGHRSRKALPGVLAKLEAVEAALARPLSVTATLPKPAVAKNTQDRVPASRLLAGAVIAEARRKASQISPSQTLGELFPGEKLAMARRTADRIYTKAATTGGTTTAVGWGAELTRSELADFWAALQERSASAQLRAIGLPVDLTGLTSVTVPRRGADDDGSLMPAWVEEGAPIPVGEARFSSEVLNRFKLGIISVVTSELIEVSNALDLIEQFILDDLAKGLDSFLFDPTSTAQPGVKPASITNGAPNQPSAGNDLPSILADIAWLRSQLSGTRRPAIVMHSDAMRALEMLATPEGQFPLASRVAARDLWGLALIDSPYVPADLVTGADASAFYHASAMPEIAVRDTVTLNIDNSGEAIRDTFQTYSTAIRVIQPATWMSLSGSVSYLTSVGWAG